MRRLAVFLTTLVMFAGTAIWFWAAVATWAAEPVPTVPGMTQSVPGLQAPLPPAATGAKQAQPAPEWSFDPAHCSMLFFVRHIFVKIPGRFAKFTGTVRFDPDNLEGSLIDVSVDMASVDTFVAKRDEDLRSPDFFDVARYPGMWFVSQRIVHKDGDQYAAEGDLTIKDVTRHIEIPFTYLGAKASPLAPDKQVAGFESHFSINMLDYHVSDGHFQKMGAMGDAVEIVLNQELTR